MRYVLCVVLHKGFAYFRNPWTKAAREICETCCRVYNGDGKVVG